MFHSMICLNMSLICSVSPGFIAIKTQPAYTIKINVIESETFRCGAEQVKDYIAESGTRAFGHFMVSGSPKADLAINLSNTYLRSNPSPSILACSGELLVQTDKISKYTANVEYEVIKTDEGNIIVKDLSVSEGLFKIIQQINSQIMRERFEGIAAAQAKQIQEQAIKKHGSQGQIGGNARPLPEKISPAMMASIDGWLLDHYNGCWHYFGTGADQSYVPKVRVRLGPDGTLIAKPTLLNPPSDANLHSLADSAIRAVNECNPLPIPAWLKPHYEAWRDRTINFDLKNRT